MSEQKYLEPISITPSMTNEQADINGVLGFAYAMNLELKECREQGKSGWHIPGSVCGGDHKENEIPRFKKDMQRAMDEGRMVDVANYAMMIYHRERMEK